jgi:hypothetical protein
MPYVVPDTLEVAKPEVVYEAPCDRCGLLAPWRTVLVASNVQETHCEHECAEAAA